MAGAHRALKPSPYSVAIGAVSYSLAVTFSKHIPVQLLASAPAAIALVASAIEHGVAVVDPKAAPAVEAKVDRLAVQAERAAADVAKIAASAVADAPHVAEEIKPLVG